jgi:O-antigen/teichoic acid export membrane protein
MGIFGVAFICLFGVFGYIFHDLLTSFNFPPVIIVYALIHAFFSQIAEVILVLWRVPYNTIRFGLFRVAKTVLDLSFSILLIIVFSMGWEGRILPQVVVSVLFGFFAIFFLHRSGYLLKLNVTKEYRKKSLSFSVPLIFHSLGGNLIGFSDRFFILYMLGLSNVGIYSVGYQVGLLIGLVQNSFNQAWVPFFYSKLNENAPSEKLKIVKISYLYFGLMIILAVSIWFLVPLVYKYFIGDAFQTGFSVVLWILLGYACNGMYKMVVNYLFYLKRTKIIAYTTLGAALINAFLNYLLIGINGIEGAAQSTFITFLLLFLVIFALSAKYYKMPWNLKP